MRLVVDPLDPFEIDSEAFVLTWMDDVSSGFVLGPQCWAPQIVKNN